MSRKDDDEKTDTFVKRPRTTDVGKDYEDIKVAQMAINLLGREDVEDFRIWSNDTNYGSFADVIVIVKWKTGETTKVAFQLKHAVTSTATVSTDSIASSTDDFSLMKTFNDYQEAVSKKPELADYIVLLLTNRNISNEQFKLGEDLIIQPEEVDDDPVAFDLSNNRDSKPLRFTMKTSEMRDEHFTINETKTDKKTKKSEQINVKYRRDEFENFLKNLYYYPQQHGVEETKTLCAEAFEKNFLSNEAKQFLDFVQDWSKRDGSKPKLTKTLISAKTAECLLSPFICVYQGKNSKKSYLFRIAINQFDVTLMDEENATKLGFIRNENFLRLMAIDKQVNDFGLTKIGLNWDQKDLQKLLWHLHESHLIVSLREDNATIISKALRLCEACGKRKFIFVTNIPYHLGGKVFQNFDDLKREDPGLFQSVGTILKISLEGKEAIPLKEILGDEEVRMRLTPSHFLRLLEEPLLIGQIPDQFTDYYISRLITDYHIDSSYVNNMETDENMTLICSNVKFAQIQAKFPNISQWSNLAAVFSDNKSKNLNFCNISQKDIVFEEICNRNKTKTCVCLEYSEDKSAFKWLKSSKIDPQLHQFRSRIPETAIKTEDYPLNIICNDPGMGKTWFLKRLKLNYPSKVVIYIEPKNHSFFDKKQTREEEYDNFLLSIAFKEKNELEKAIFKYLYLKKKVVILWDGLDEASQEKLPNIFNAVDYFKNIGLSQWIASREHLRGRLENRFNILSRAIEEFDETQQEEYIKQRLRNNEETINSCAKMSKDIMNRLRPNYVNQLFGIPLQLFMLTELFLQEDLNISEKLTSGVCSIATLYQHFLNGKFKVHEQEKIGWNLEIAKDQEADLFLKNEKSLEENFEKAALRALSLSYNRSMLKGDDISCAKFLDDIMKNGDNCGLITFVDKPFGDDLDEYAINFAHQTFAEFLGARYIVKNYKHDLEKTTEAMDILGREKFKNVRFFIDVMMAEDSELHLAVLYRDVEKVKQLEKRPDCKDGLGRNPLTLAALQGTYYRRQYVLLPNDHHWGTKAARDHIELPSISKDDALAEIFSHLTTCYELNERDEYLLMLIQGIADENPSLWPLLNKELFESVPAPSYHAKYDEGCLYKRIAASNIPSLTEFATRMFQL